ncbi:tetratricopeptide repeat protein [Actinophytocola sp.]|uniref:AfsR/SARP family transcriptional regulator n=1 Tax=Actinophytocola sp. TaxID=1872138 RepID=UPI003D6BD760
MTEPDAWFGVLGPLLIRRGGASGTEVAVDRPQRRTLVALLLLHANRVVSTEEIIDQLWGADPPATVRTQVHTLVSALRRTLPGGGRILRTESSGYRLELATAALDLLTFSEQLARARKADHAGDRTRAVAGYRAALRLWRDVPFAGIGAGFVDQARRSLTEKRLAATEQLIDLELADPSADPAGLVEELARLVEEHPLRSGLRQRLMLVLHRAGRPADAMAVYLRGRDLLADEHGLDPSPELDRLASRIEAADPSLDAPAVPRQLPYAAACFTGRTAELAALDALLDGGGEHPVAVVSGTGGVGKTAVATHWAHSVADRFDGGQLYVDLRGYSPEEPVPPAEALAGFLRALGVDGRGVPTDLAGRAALFQTMLSGRRLLVLLDNARDPEQVAPLLPPRPGPSVVVVTSRDRLDPLVAGGARHIGLDVLPPPESEALLRALIGERADAGAIAELARRCACLPLALRIAAERVAARPDTPLPELVTELADQRRAVHLLDTGDDPHSAVSAVFSWSYRQLTPAAARTMRLFGLHRGPSLDLAAVAALTGTSVERAREPVAELLRAHLVGEITEDRFTMHDLLRAWAGERAGAVDPAKARRAASARLFDHYRHGAAAAMDLLHPYERHQRPPVGGGAGAGPHAPVFGDVAAARRWLTAEIPNLVAAAGTGTDSAVIELSATVWRHLESSGRYDEADILAGLAATAARRRSDPTALAGALTVLGLICWRRNEHELAVSRLTEALAVYRKLGDVAGTAWTRLNLGVVYERTGRFDLAIEHLRDAQARYAELDDPIGQANALGNLGVVHEQTGNYMLAVELQKRSFALHLDADNPVGMANALGNVGIVHHRAGRHEHAGRCLRQALTLFGDIGDRAGEAEALGYLGAVLLALEERAAARERLEHGLAMAREIGNRRVLALILNGLGELSLATGDMDAALAAHTAALHHAAASGDREQRARADTALRVLR